MQNITSHQLLNSGLALVPIPLGFKSPTQVGWNSTANVVTNPKMAYRLTGGNIGLAHAYSSPNPTCAIDIDNYINAKSWLFMHRIDLDALLMLNDAVVIWSGKKYSLKLLYRLPSGVSALESKKINGSDSKSAIEFRCATKDGKTVQDLIPPSIHPDGHQYQWMGKGDPLQIPQIPTSLLNLWHLLIENGSRVALRQQNTTRHNWPETPLRLALANDALNHISADCDYETWRNVIWAILSTGWLCAEDIAFAWSRTAPHRFDEDTFWLSANSYLPDHPTPITLGSIYHHARLGGWHV